MTMPTDRLPDLANRRLRSGEVAHRAGVNVQQRARTKRAEIEQKIHDLALIWDTLDQVITARCDSLTSCTCPDCPLPFADLASLADLADLAEGDLA